MWRGLGIDLTITVMTSHEPIDRNWCHTPFQEDGTSNFTAHDTMGRFRINDQVAEHGHRAPRYC